MAQLPGTRGSWVPAPVGTFGPGWKWFEAEPELFPHLERVSSVLGKAVTAVPSAADVMLEIIAFASSLCLLFHKCADVHFLNLTFVISPDPANINGIRPSLPSAKWPFLSPQMGKSSSLIPPKTGDLVALGRMLKVEGNCPSFALCVFSALCVENLRL